MKPRVRKRHYRRGEEEEKEEKASIEREKEERTQSRVGPPTAPHIIVQLMKDGIPHCSLDVRPQIFIEAIVRATIMTPDLERFSHFKIVCEFALILV